MDYLKEYRKSKGLTQGQMAFMLGYSYSHYTKIEGDFSQPSFTFLKNLKMAFPDFDLNEMVKKSSSNN